MKGEWIKFSNISLIELNFYLKYNFKHMSNSLGNIAIHKNTGKGGGSKLSLKKLQSIEE